MARDSFVTGELTVLKEFEKGGVRAYVEELAWPDGVKRRRVGLARRAGGDVSDSPWKFAPEELDRVVETVELAKAWLRTAPKTMGRASSE